VEPVSHPKNSNESDHRSIRDPAQYDVICAGGGLSANLSAALLAKSGKRVLLIEDEDYARPRVFDKGIYFDPDFTPFCSFEARSILGRCFKELGIDVSAELKPLKAITQVLSSRYRIAFSQESKETLQEIQREVEVAPQTVAGFFGLLYKVGEKSPVVLEKVLTLGQANRKDIAHWRKFWGSYYKSIHGHQPVKLQTVLRAQRFGDGARECEILGSALLGGLSFAAPNNLGFEQVVRSLPLYLAGQGLYSGGIASLKTRLADYVKSHGGAVRTTTVEALSVEKKKITGVVLSSFEGVCKGDLVILCGKLRRLYRQLPNSFQEQSVVRSLDRIQPSHWRFTIAVSIEKDVLPIGITPHMTYLGSPNYPLEEENFLRIQTISDENAEQATILVTALVPYRASSLDYGYLRRLAGKMMQALSSLIPFLDKHVVSIYPDFRANDLAIRELYPFKGPDWVSENLLQYYVRGHRGVQEFWGPTLTTPHRNLYFGGRSIWPALGLYGEVLSARKIYEDIQRL